MCRYRVIKWLKLFFSVFFFFFWFKQKIGNQFSYLSDIFLILIFLMAIFFLSQLFLYCQEYLISKITYLTKRSTRVDISTKVKMQRNSDQRETTLFSINIFTKTYVKNFHSGKWALAKTDSCLQSCWDEERLWWWWSIIFKIHRKLNLQFFI